MSKIDDFNHAKAVADQIRDATAKFTRKDSPTNDKGVLRFLPTTNSTVPELLSVEAGYGVYGNSSFWTLHGNPTFMTYLRRALDNLFQEIADEMVRQAERDLEAAAEDAREEARGVLAVTFPHLKPTPARGE